MKSSPKLSSALATILLLTGVSLSGCIDPNAPGYPYGSPDPYPIGGGYSGGYGSPYYRDRDYDRRERREIERERREIERERDRVARDRERDRIEEERRQLERERQRVYSSPRREESCPPGFSPSEQKCSSEERRRGCRDMRLPGGLGCVDRN
jgi:hypothetical protein